MGRNSSSDSQRCTPAAQRYTRLSSRVRTVVLVVAQATVQATSGLFQTISPSTRIADAMQKIALKISEAALR